MGWARGTVRGREVGYGVRAKCDWHGCKTKIDRGLAYRCGGLSGISLDEGIGCGGYFCGEHRKGIRRLSCATSTGGHYYGEVCNDCAKSPSKRRKIPVAPYNKAAA